MDTQPMIAASDSQISDEQMARYAKLIYEVTGNVVSASKKALLSNRLRRRLRETGIADYDAYFTHLKSLKDGHPEWAAFLQEVTTHETYLFRDDSHWKWLQRTYLANVAQEAATGKRPKSLRFWSAACSTGDEACSIALSLADLPGSASGWDLKIFGTDIGAEAVAAAKLGVFGERSMRLVPERAKSTWFTKLSGAAGECWKVKPDLWRWCDFRQHNLLQPFKAGPFDVVFLKNVLIYFDDSSKARVVAGLRKTLKPGAFLIVGAAEGAAEHLKDFKRHQPWLFQWQPMGG